MSHSEAKDSQSMRGGRTEQSAPDRPIRVAVTYRVCQGWRATIFQRLAAHPMIDLKVFHGPDIRGTKMINAKNFDGFKHEELKTYILKVKSSGRTAFAMIYPGIGRRLNEYRPDVLLCEGGSNIFNNLLIYRWAKRHRVPTIWWGLGEIPGRQYRGISKLYQWVRLRLMRQSTVLLGYSTRATDYFKRMKMTQPVFKAVNCVDTDRVFARIEEANRIQPSLRNRMGLASRKVLLFVGAIESTKRLDVLLNAYQRLQERFKDLSLVIVGNGPVLPELRQQADNLKLCNVHFPGNVVEGVSEYFLAADLFVLPGLGGLAISEAMAHGLPVICTVADGCEIDLVQNGQNGYILPPDDVDALTEAIAKILADPQHCAEMGLASRRIIEQQYNVHTYVQGIVDAVRCAHQAGVDASDNARQPVTMSP